MEKRVSGEHEGRVVELEPMRFLSFCRYGPSPTGSFSPGPYYPIIREREN